MSKLPAPVAHYSSAPVPRPIPHAYGGPEAKRILDGGIAEVLDGTARRAFGQRGLRQPPELEFERPPRDSYRFAGPRAAPADDAGPRPGGPSAAFLAQLIGQSVQAPGRDGGSAGSGEAGPAHSAYREAGGKASPQIDDSRRLDLSV